MTLLHSKSEVFRSASSEDSCAQSWERRITALSPPDPLIPEDPHPLQICRRTDVLCHVALCVHQLYEGQVIFTAHIGVVLTESRSDVYDSSTVCQRYIGIAERNGPFCAAFRSTA